MATVTSLSSAPDLSVDDYIVVGLAICFLREESEVHEVKVVEPIPSAALEAIMLGSPTSYQQAIATTLGAIIQDDTPQLPTEFPADTQICDDFVERAISASRTYKSRPASQTLIPDGTIYDQFNHSTERKRILNSERLVRTEDNVKQHEYTHKVL